MNGTDEPSEGLGLPAPKHQAQTATHTSPAHDDATGMR
jgi:hypothetical protein